MCARGEAPNVARLIEMGVAFGHGAMSSLPTVTLANHTSIITGAHPGHHGILNNAWFDRATGEQVITNSQATWPWSMKHLTPGIESIHDVVHRTWPDAFTASVNEPCDTGADYSTFDFFRRGEVPPIPKDPFGLPAHDRAIRAPVEGLLVVVGRRPHGRRPGARHPRRPLPRRELPDAALHVVQLHAHRRRDARRRPALRDGGGVGPRQRRPGRRDPRRARAARRVRRLRLRARRRPRHGGERPDVPAATGTSRSAPRASTPATRPTASCTSAPEPAVDTSEVRMRKVSSRRARWRSSASRVLAACGGSSAKTGNGATSSTDAAGRRTAVEQRRPLRRSSRDASKQKFKVTYTDGNGDDAARTRRTATATAMSRRRRLARPSSRTDATVTLRQDRRQWPRARSRRCRVGAVGNPFIGVARRCSRRTSPRSAVTSAHVDETIAGRDASASRSREGRLAGRRAIRARLAGKHLDGLGDVLRRRRTPATYCIESRAPAHCSSKSRDRR